MGKKRIVWLDMLKGFLIFSVVLGHSMQYTELDETVLGEKIWYFIYSFHMMAFFAASGFLFYPKWILAEDKKKFLFRREIALIVPTAVFSAINVLLRFLTHQDQSLLASVSVTLKSFWFLGVLMLLEGFYPLLLIICKNKRLWIEILLGAGWLVCGFWNNEIGKFLGYFFIFVFAGRIKEIIDTPRGEGTKIAIEIGSLAIFVVALLVCYRTQGGTDGIANSYVKLLLGLPGSCWLMLLFSRIFANTKENPCSRLGQYTMQIYLVHQILFAFSPYLFGLLPSVVPIIWMCILCVLGNLIPVLLEKGMDRTPGLRLVFHPMR